MEWDSRGQWQCADHLQVLCNHLEAVERKEILRLMIFMPPRHGKSEVVSKKFPAWYLGRHPSSEVILTSYAADLAYDFSRICRTTLEDQGERLWNVKIDPRNRGVEKWGLLGTRGGLTAAGVGGPITGRGADIAIIDDPFKNWQEAASETIRENVWNWYRSTLRTRLMPRGAVILVMTRWHEDDLAGRLLKEMRSEGDDNEEWYILNLAAEADENDQIGRKNGEWLWPTWFSEQEYRQLRKSLGSYLWSAMYQQKPSPPEGHILKREWWKYYKALPDISSFNEIILSWDMAFKDGKENDFVVGQVWGRVGANKYLLAQVRDRMDYPTTKQAVRNMIYAWPRAYAKYVEEKANGAAIIQELTSEFSGLIPVKPTDSKEARAAAVSPQLEAGNVWIPDPSIAPWISDFVEECAAFPTGSHDDQVDACTQALLKLEHGQFGIDVF